MNETTERKNPFMEPYHTPHDTIPFDKIRFEDFEPAFMEGIRRDDEDIEIMLNNPAHGGTGTETGSDPQQA